MIYEILPVNNYQGNKVSVNFDFDFYIEDESQLKVTLYDKNNVKHTLLYNIDYSINEFKNQNGSYITFPLEGSSYNILSEDEKLSIELTLPIEQQTQYNNSSLLNLEALEYSLDYLTRLIQIYARKMSLCVKVDECSALSADTLISSIYENANNAKISADSASDTLNTIISNYDSYLRLSSEVLEQLETVANADLSDLSSQGRARFQYAPFSINNGAI